MATDPITGGEDLAGKLVDVAAAVQVQMNTADMIAAKVAASIQKHKDDLNAALIAAQANPTLENIQAVQTLLSA